jgi:hypothetical protein
MSKRISRFLALLSVLGLAMGTVIFTHTSGASAPQRAGLANSTTRNAAIVAATDAVLKETSELRELSILRPVKSGAQSRTDIERMLIKNLDEQTTPAQMHATEVSLRKFGLTPSDFEFRPFIIKLLTEQVAGYYDPRGQEFHLADWLELEGQKPVMAHELTHALQDQHFNLRRFEKWPHGDSDAELAAHALIEGDATLAMTIYMAKNPMVALAFVRSLGATGASSEQFNQAPRALRESLVFPYVQGMEWTRELYKRGGWTLVSKAFTKLPESTEQILHPEKYFDYEHPVRITLPDLTNLLNVREESVVSNQQSALSHQQSSGTTSRRSLPTANRPLPTDSWHRIDSDVNGEWSYYLILDQFLKSPADSRRAAAGWAGDRYALYEGPKQGQVFLAQVTAWDTENDAREFFDAYVKRSELRYPGATHLDSADLKLQTPDVYSCQTSEGGVVIERRGLHVLIIEGVPQGVDPTSLMKALS